MVLIHHTHKIWNLDDATETAAMLNADDDWTYIVEPNPQEVEPTHAIIRIYDEHGDYVGLL